VEELYPVLLDIGFTSQEFYEMTFAEMQAEIKAFRNRRRLKVLDDYNQALITVRGISTLFSKDSEMPTPQEIWGNDLFDDMPQAESEQMDLAKMHADFQLDLIRVEMDALKK